MRQYSISKPLSTVNTDWIYWTTPHLKDIDQDSNQIAALLFITRKEEIEVLYKPTPIIND